MALDHERLDVYSLTLDFITYANRLLADLPRGNRPLADQLSRASTSIALNLAEGVGKHSAAEKRRFYIIARGSAFESAATLDVLLRLELITAEKHAIGKTLIERIVSMLVKLANAFA